MYWYTRTPSPQFLKPVYPATGGKPQTEVPEPSRSLRLMACPSPALLRNLVPPTLPRRLSQRSSSCIFYQGCLACGLQAACSSDGYECGPTQNHKLFKTFAVCSSGFVSDGVLNVWPKTTLLLPVWPREAKRLDAPAGSERVKQALQQASSARVSCKKEAMPSVLIPDP